MEGLKPCQFRQVDTHGRILCNLIKGGDREVSVNLCRVCPVSQINCQHLRASIEKKVSTPITVRFATGRVEVWDDTPPSIDFKQAACAAKTMPIQSPRDCSGCPIRLPNIIPTNAIQVAHHTKQNAAAAPARAAAQAPAALQASAASQAPTAARAPRAAAPNRAQPVAQAVSELTAQPVAQPVAASAPAAIDIGAANDLIARARATAARKQEEKETREHERQAREQQAQYAQPEGKSKIIQLQDWLAGQLIKKQNGNAAGPSPYKPQAVRADEDGVSDIIYAPLGGQTAGAYQEVIDYERCVGWTD